MKVLVINCGSSSLKFQLINMDDESVMCKGICDRIGNAAASSISYKTGDKKFEEKVPFPTHAEAFDKLVDMMTSGESQVVADKSEITAIGHRVVQGAEFFKKSEIATEAIIQKIDEISPLAPVHNPAHVQGLRCAQKTFGDIPNVVVFDTTFHQTMPPKAYMFGIPYSFYKDHAIRRYGAHGTSHRYVSRRVAELMGKKPEEIKVVTCHLGNGSSITAVDGGKCVDTSMGLTPLGGILMGTAEMDSYLNKKSGYLGLSGLSSDHRDLFAAASEGNKRAALALEIQGYQIQKFIGSYAAAMNGLDAIVFTGGIGENAWDTRHDVCKNMEFLGIEIDEELNKTTPSCEVCLSKPGSRVQVWIVPTNEELAIARDTLALV